MTVEVLAVIGMVMAYFVGQIVAHRTAKHGGRAMLEAIVVGIIVFAIIGYIAHRLSLL